MTIHIHWRALLSAYVRMWGALLLIPLAFITLALGFMIYDTGSVSGIFMDWKFTLQLLAMKAAIYGAFAAIQMLIVAAVNLYELLLRPAWRRDETPIRPMIGSR